jgi:hypothetical protein
VHVCARLKGGGGGAGGAGGQKRVRGSNRHLHTVHLQGPHAHAQHVALEHLRARAP